MQGEVRRKKSASGNIGLEIKPPNRTRISSGFYRVEQIPDKQKLALRKLEPCTKHKQRSRVWAPD